MARGEQARDALVRLRLQVLEGEVLELMRDLAEAQPMRQRCVDLHRLARHAYLLVGLAGRRRVRMLCRRSASLITTTRMSSAIARNILRRLSAWTPSSQAASSGRSRLRRLSLVTPSTRRATSAPKRCADGSSLRDAAVLDDVVQQGSGDRCAVEVEVRDGHRRVDRVNDVGLAGLAVLSVVRLVGEVVGLFDQPRPLRRNRVACVGDQVGSGRNQSFGHRIIVILPPDQQGLRM